MKTYFLDVKNNDPPLKWWEFKKSILILTNKPMKKEDLLTTFEALNPARNSKGYEIIKDLLTGKNKSFCVTHKPDAMGGKYFIRPCHLEGIGRNARNVDYTDEVRGYLDALSIAYVFSNTAPRNARTGNLITVLTQIH